MRNGAIFWGVILILIGVLFILQNFGLVVFDWSDIARWWPLLLIYWGIMAMTDRPGARWLGLFLFFLVAASLVLLSVQNGWADRPEIATDQTLNESLKEGVTNASLLLQSGAGQFTINSVTGSDLVTAKSNTSFGEYQLATTYTGSQASAVLSLNQTNRHPNPMMGHMRNDLTVSLNTAPIWDITVESGASSIDLNLANLAVDNLVVKSGASAVEVALGDKSANSKVEIKTGASSVSLVIPTTVGAQITAASGLSSRDFSGFDAIGDNVYQTKDYSSAAKKMDIRLDAGVSSLEVKRR